jgi:hypothetical protein
MEKNTIWFFDHKKQCFLKVDEEELKTIVAAEDFKIIGLVACHRENLEFVETSLIQIGLLNPNAEVLEVLSNDKTIPTVE